MDNNSTQFINETYDNLSYFDIYGTSVFLFIIITLVVFSVFSFCKIMQKKEDVANNWNAERCKPQNIMFAGFINKPDDKTAFEYTNENFQYCVQNILLNITGYALEPFQYMLSSLTGVFKELGDSLQKIREVFDKLRNNFKTFAQDVMGRVLNIVVPLQQMLIAVVDSFQKIQGIMTTGLYTMLGTYYTLKALLGAILELIIKLLVVLVIIIVGLWVMPFTWPMATSLSAIFLALSVPLAIVVYFMSEVMHIQTDAVPKLRCFDENTELIMNNESRKKIKDIVVGDVLQNNIIVTSTMKLDARGLKMFYLGDVIVSESHIVYYHDHWIPVKEHPRASLIMDYPKPYIYCLNTTAKIIIVNNTIFTDWDEIYDEKIEQVLDYYGIELVSDIHKYTDFGLNHNQLIKTINGNKKIEEICIGDILESKGIVYGIVKMDNLGEGKEILYNLLVSNKLIITDTGSLIRDYNYAIDVILHIKKNFI